MVCDKILNSLKFNFQFQAENVVPANEVLGILTNVTVVVSSSVSISGTASVLRVVHRVRNCCEGRTPPNTSLSE